jgi:hypothetical protein
VSGQRSSTGDRSVRVPFKVVDGTLTYFYGGELPALAEGCIGELVVPARDITDLTERTRLERRQTAPLLPKGTHLLMRMRAADRTNVGPGCVLNPQGVQGVPLSLGLFVWIVLREDLLLYVEGAKRGFLARVKCMIPALENREAKSLNHAYGLISEKFERERLSHTGNVFEQAFVEGERGWLELDLLRSAAEARYEHLLTRDSGDQAKAAK